MVRKSQASKEFRRHDDSIPYLDNAKFILFRTTQNGFRLSYAPLLPQNLMWTESEFACKNSNSLAIITHHHFLIEPIQKSALVRSCCNRNESEESNNHIL